MADDLRINLGGPLRPVGSCPEPATPRELWPDAIRRIAAAWNEAVPSRRVRVISRARTIDLCALLEELTCEEVCQAIRFYGRQTWQRTHNAWKRFDDWLPVALLWFEDSCRAEDAAEAAEHRRARATAEEHAAREAAMAAKRADTEAQVRFDSLPALERMRIEEQAKRDLGVLAGMPRLVRTRCIELMKAGVQPAGLEAPAA